MNSSLYINKQIISVAVLCWDVQSHAMWKSKSNSDPKLNCIQGNYLWVSWENFFDSQPDGYSVYIICLGIFHFVHFFILPRGRSHYKGIRVFYFLFMLEFL